MRIFDNLCAGKELMMQSLADLFNAAAVPYKHHVVKCFDHCPFFFVGKTLILSHFDTSVLENCIAVSSTLVSENSYLGIRI